MSENTRQPVGLRSKKKRETENAIEEAAVDLALELGHDAVTVDAICARAGVGRSTFFNYFPSRETAITGRIITMLRGDAADRILDDNASSLPRALLLLTFASIGHAHINAQVARKRQQLAAEQPATIRHTAASLLSAGDQLIEIAAGWLVRNPQHSRLGDPVREAAIAAGLTHTIFSAINSESITRSGDATVAMEAIDRAIVDARALLV